MPLTNIPPIDELEVVNGLQAFVNTQTNSFPLPWGSSSGGFTFSVDPTTGGPVLRAKSFGPFFTERPLTSGKHVLNVTASFQRTHWKSVDGAELDDIFFEESPDALPTNLETCASANEGCPSHRWAANLSLKTSVAVVGVSYGIGDNFDVGVSLPFKKVSVSGSAALSDSFSLQPGGVVQASLAATGSSTGLSDIGVRVKYNLSDQTRPVGWQFALSGEVRLPTGDPEQLTGAGRRQVKGNVLGEFAADRLSRNWLTRTSFHFNFGYTLAGNGFTISEPRVDRFQSSTGSQVTGDFVVDVPDELNYSLGLDLAILDDVSFIADVFGRTLLSGAEYVNYWFVSDKGTHESQPFLFERENMNLWLGTIGTKAHLGFGWLLHGHVLFPLTDTGLTPGITPILGLEWDFR